MMKNTSTIHLYNVLRAQERLIDAQKELVAALKLQAKHRVDHTIEAAKFSEKNER